MDEKKEGLISKKDLLEFTGISYGQLYRWKREGLIPEEWFIKRSAFTGQKTFFPREPALARISSILEHKDSHSLAELAKLLNPEKDRELSISTLAAAGLIRAGFAERAESVFGGGTMPGADGAYVAALDEALGEERLTERAEEKFLRSTIKPGSGIILADAVLVVFEAWGEPHAVIYKSGKNGPGQNESGQNTPGGEIRFDAGIRIIKAVRLDETLRKINLKLGNIEGNHQSPA